MLAQPVSADVFETGSVSADHTAMHTGGDALNEAAVLAALGAFGAYKLIEHIAKPQKRAAKFAAVSASATIGSLLNTALVVSMFVLILPSLTAGGATLAVAVPQMLISGAIECVCMAAITPPITLTLNKVVLRGKDLRNRSVPQTPEVSDK